MVILESECLFSIKNYVFSYMPFRNSVYMS